jgi:hypothetical protein
MLPRYRLDFTRDAADQMAYGEVANDGKAVHLLTIELVPFAFTLVGSHVGGDNSAHHNFCDLILRRVLPLARPLQHCSEAKRKSGSEFLIE